MSHIHCLGLRLLVRRAACTTGPFRGAKKPHLWKAFAQPLPSSAQAAITEYHRAQGWNNRHLVSHSSRGWKSKIRVSARWDCGASSLPGLQAAVILLRLAWQKERRAASSPGSLLIRVQIPMGRPPQVTLGSTCARTQARKDPWRNMGPHGTLNPFCLMSAGDEPVAACKHVLKSLGTLPIGGSGGLCPAGS